MSSLQWILLTSGLLRLACAGNAQVTLDASAQAHVQLETTRLIRSHRRPTESEQRKHGSSPGVGVIQAEILGNESLLLDQRLQSVARMLRVGSPTKDFLMKLSLCVPCGQFEKFGDQNQGYVMCTEDLDRSTIAAAYSYGVDGNDSWGTDMASRYGFAVHEYAKDCGEPRRPLVCSGCHMNFHTDCTVGAHGPLANSKIKTLTQNLQDNADTEDGTLLLKLDANGNEWEVFAEEPVSTLQKFRQVVVKFHKVTHQEKHSLYLRAVRKLEESGFAVAFLSGQNYGKLTHFERDLRDYHIPDELQVVYMQLPSQGCSQELKYRVPDEIPDIVPEQTVLEEQLPSASGHV